MAPDTRIVLTGDHAAVPLRQGVATLGWEAVDIGPATPLGTPCPEQARAAALRVASGDRRFGIMLSLGARVIAEGLAMDIVNAFLATEFEDGRHTARVEMIEAKGV